MFNTINIGLSPNLRPIDSFLALKLLFQPWRWTNGEEVRELENWFKKFTGVKSALAVNSGRSAEYLILKAMGIGEGDEVLIQAFTCVAVPNSILWTGAKPIYVDIDETLNMDPTDLERKITPKAKAVIVQHTFGIPAKIGGIQKIADKHNILLIEDCAHVIKPEIKGQAAFYSFGRDKAVSSVFGGIAVTNGTWNREQGTWENASYFWIWQQLFHPVVSMFILPLYNVFGIGKVILFILQKLGLLSLPVYPEEKISERPKIFPARLPNALAILALNQLKNLEEFNKKRVQIAKCYKEELKNLPIKIISEEEVAFLRFPIITERAEELRVFAKKQGIILGNWFSNIIDPKGVELTKVGYQMGSCPTAEKIARQVVNLPTYPRMSENDIEKVIKIIYDFYQRN